MRIFAFACLTAILSAQENQDPSIQDIRIEDQLLLEDNKLLLQDVLHEYVSQPLSLENVEAIQEQILAWYQRQGHQEVLITVPNQEVSNGVITYRVEESNIGKVTYTGRSWDLGIQTGETLHIDTIQNKVSWLNRNPFHSSTVILSPGRRGKETDIEVVTKSRFPWRFYVGADDTGTQTTGQERLYTGFNWGNAFGLDDLLTFQYTASPDFHQFNSYLLSYTSFLPWKHVLSVYGGYAVIHPDIVGFRHEGKNLQASLRYEVPFKPFYTPLIQEVTWGFDYKDLNNNLFFESDFAPFIIQAVKVTQFYLSYGLKDKFERHDLVFKAELYASPFHHPHYSDLREGAKSTYLYGRLSLGDLYRIHPKFKFNWLVRGEASTGALLPSEQFGLGGYDTVRGYEERIFNADNAICANFEVQSTPFSIFKKDALFFLAFFDSAWGYNYDAAEGFPSHQFLVGVGPGLRYTVGTYLNLRFDYGFQLKHVEGDDHFGRLHFGVTLSY